jgi:hypothetical protein
MCLRHLPFDARRDDGLCRSSMGAPSEISRVAEVMADFGPPWALCGSWAVDAWLGKTTRSHEDVDVSIREEHQTGGSRRSFRRSCSSSWLEGAVAEVIPGHPWTR